MDKKDLYIKERLQVDQNISSKCNDIFNNFKGEEYMIDKEKKVIKISLKSFIAIAASIAIVGTLGINLYAKSKGKPNFISSLQALTQKEENIDGVAKDLFEKGIIAIRDSNNYCKISEDAEQKVIENRMYIKTDTKYDDVKKEYEKIFIDEALENALKLNFYNIDGMAYVIEKAGGTPWELKELKVEKINENNGEFTYKAIYKLSYSDDSANKEPTEQSCEFKIKNVNGEYRIFATNYINIEEKTMQDIELLNNANLKEIGFSFDYPVGWTYDRLNGGCSVSYYDSYDYSKFITFNISYWSTKDTTTPKELVESDKKYHSFDEEGSIKIGDNEGYFWTGNPNGRKDGMSKNIYVESKENGVIYYISFDGHLDFYNKYYETFEKMLKTIKFDKIEENNNIAQNSNNNVNKSSETVQEPQNQQVSKATIIGDANCDGSINNKDLTAITKHINGEIELTNQGVINADVNEDGYIAQLDIDILMKYLSGEYSKLPQEEYASCYIAYDKLYEKKKKEGKRIPSTYYDINKDGTTDFIILTGENEIDKKAYFYTFKNGRVVELGTTFMSHSILYEVFDENCLMKLNGHMGYERVYKLYIENDKIVEKLVSEREINPQTEDYQKGDRELVFGKGL